MASLNSGNNLCPDTLIQFRQDGFQVARGGNGAVMNLEKKEKAAGNHFNFIARAQQSERFFLCILSIVSKIYQIVLVYLARTSTNWVTASKGRTNNVSSRSADFNLTDVEFILATDKGQAQTWSQHHIHNRELIQPHVQALSLIHI